MSNGTNETVNREYKDRLFNFIFGREENREWTLSLYNAINGSAHTDPSFIEFNTLGDVVYIENCGPLMEYSWFVDRIRGYQKDDSLEGAMKKAIEEMPNDFRIKRFLYAHMEEIKGMLDTEYNEAEVNEAFKEEGRAEGREEGREEGRREERVNIERERKRADKAESEVIKLREEIARLKGLTPAK